MPQRKILVIVAMEIDPNAYDHAAMIAVGGTRKYIRDLVSDTMKESAFAEHCDHWKIVSVRDIPFGREHRPEGQ